MGIQNSYQMFISTNAQNTIANQSSAGGFSHDKDKEIQIY
jgi:hypothetical protein